MSRAVWSLLISSERFPLHKKLRMVLGTFVGLVMVKLELFFPKLFNHNKLYFDVADYHSIRGLGVHD